MYACLVCMFVYSVGKYFFRKFIHFAGKSIHFVEKFIHFCGKSVHFA